MTKITNILSLFFIIILVGCASTQDIINSKKDAVLLIIKTVENKSEQLENSPMAIGTGFFIGENEIVTNAHVVIDSQKLQASMEYGKEFYDLEIVYIDKNIDIAVVKFKDWDKFQKNNKYEILEFANSSLIKTIDRVYAIGNPWGLTWSVTEGIVVNKLRRMSEIPQYTIQTDAHIFNGNSGGPLLNIDGKIIGMNSLMYAQNGGSFGFAIHANIIKKVINDFKKYKEVRWVALGIVLKNDLTIDDIDKDSAAYHSKLNKNDKIVGISVGRHIFKITNLDEMIFLLSTIDYDQNIEFRVLRNNNLHRIKIKPKYKLSTDFSPSIRQ